MTAARVAPTILRKLLGKRRALPGTALPVGGIREQERDEQAWTTPIWHRFVRSEAFVRSMKSIAEAVEDLKEVQRKERSAHQNTWAKQTSLLEQIESSKAVIDIKMAEIVEGPSLVALPDAAAD